MPTPIIVPITNTQVKEVVCIVQDGKKYCEVEQRISPDIPDWAVASFCTTVLVISIVVYFKELRHDNLGVVSILLSLAMGFLLTICLCFVLFVLTSLIVLLF